MYANSAPVHSSQTGPHPRLLAVCRRHRAQPWRQPVSVHGQQAFAATERWLAARPTAPLLLDAGCGTGASSVWLAERRPEALVIGVDQSAERLRRGRQSDVLAQTVHPRVLLLRAPLEDYWRLLATAGITLDELLLWYPNPWPKPGHLQRRWHGHPLFSLLPTLARRLELRSNWLIYMQEFQLALADLGIAAEIEAVAPAAPPVSPFERKYRDSGHALWVLRAHLPRA